MRSDLGFGHSRLRPPIVVHPDQVPGSGKRDLKIQLTAVERSGRKHPARKTVYALAPPAVVFRSIVWHGPGIKLAPTGDAENRISRRGTLPILRPPIVVTAIAVEIFFGPKVALDVTLPGQQRHRVSRYDLSPPSVVGAGIAWHGPGVYLTLSYRRRGRGVLSPPTVVTAVVTEVFTGPKTHFTLGRRPTVKSVLHEPQVVFQAVELSGPEVFVARIRPVKTKTSLVPPTVIDLSPQVFYFSLTLAPQRRARPIWLLSPPTVVFTAVELFGPETTLVPSHKGKTLSRLSPPVVVFLAVELSGPDVHLTYSRRGLAKSVLESPVVIDLSPQVFYLNLSLIRIAHPSVAHVLRPPIVVFIAVELSGPEISLTVRRQQAGKARLFPPTVVTPEFVGVFYGPAVHLTRIHPSRVGSDLYPPIVVLRQEAPLGGVMVQLVRRPTPETTTRLFPPAVFAQPEVLGELVATLAESRRGKPRSTFVFPYVVFETEAFGYVAIQLVRRPLTFPKSRFAPPAVVGVVQEVVYGPQVTLVRARPRKVRYFLRAPAILATNEPTKVTFAPSRRGEAKSQLFPPTVVFLAVEIYGPDTSLARITPPPVIARIRPPVVVFEAVELSGPEIALVRIAPQPTQARLNPPVVVGEVVYFGPATELAPSSRGLPKSRLTPPTVVDTPPAFLPPERVILTPSSRGIPKSQLFPPAVIGAGKVNPGLRRYLVARQTRILHRFRKTTAQLRPPVVVFTPELAFGPQVKLAPSKRGKPKSFLRPPVVLGSAGTLQVHLTYSKRGKPKSFLRPPAVVFRAVEIFGPEITLAPSKRGFPHTTLRPPAVVGKAPFAPIRTFLAPQPKPETIYQLVPPAVVGEIVFFGPEVSLVPSSFGRPKSVLKPPTVVEEADRFFGPIVHFVRIKPPKVINFTISAVVATPFIPPRGKVCGFDIAGSFICYVELPGTKVSGGDQAGSHVHGTTARSAKVTGDDSAGGSVSGGDRPAE